jgi:hypothetical protein
MTSPDRVPPNAPGGAGAPASASAQPCWPERHIARRNAAKHHLEACGFWVGRADPDPAATALTKWQVSGVAGHFVDGELVAFARQYGFEGGEA